MNKQNEFTKIISNLNSLFSTYTEDDFCTQKLITYLSNTENYITTQKKEFNERTTRKLLLEEKKNEFIKIFLEKHKYSYINEAGMFIEYNDRNYTNITNNKLINTIFGCLIENNDLHPWRQKVKIELLAQIKSNSFNDVIPESATIQHILNIFAGVISPSKYHAKFLLTIIGDILCKKSTNAIYLVDNKILKFLEILEYNINKYINCKLPQHFKYKYYNYEYDSMYVVYLKDTINNSFLWEHLIIKYIFDIMAVAYHYSKRHENAVNYLTTHCADTDAKSKILLLKENTKQTIIKEFSTLYLHNCVSLQLTQQEAIYLWKKFLSERNLPQIMFTKDVLELLEQKYTLQEGKYQNVSSPHLKYVNVFATFIKETITFNKEYQTNELMVFEISELQLLFNKWQNTNNTNIAISEDTIIQLLNNFYEECIIKDNKYIHGCVSNMWKKVEDLQQFMLNEKYSSTKQPLSILYKKYCVYCKQHEKEFIVSKSYFNKYIDIVMHQNKITP